MELWIRSQDRERLTTVCDLRIVYLGEEKLWAIDCCDYVGFYQTKKRALEILDIIQTLLTYSTATVGQLKDAFKDYKELPKVSINSIGVVVYEMPKE